MTKQSTKENVAGYIDSFIHAECSRKTTEWEDVKECLFDMNGEDKKEVFGDDFIIEFDYAHGLMSGDDEGEPQCLYWSKKIRKFIIITSMAPTAYDNAHFFAEQINALNDEALTLESQLPEIK